MDKLTKENLENNSKFDPEKIKKTNTDKIWAHVNEIRTKIKSRCKLKDIQEEYSWLYDNYPKIFSLACNEKMDLDKLKFMLSKLSGIKNGNLSEYEASGIVGTAMAREYVYSKLDMSKEPNVKL